MLDYFVHEKAIVETTNVGPGTKIWAFVHILPHAKIGSNVNISDHCFIENDVEIGNNVTIKSGIYLWEGLRVEDNVFIGPAAVFTNDLRPRSNNVGYEKRSTILKRGCSIGANAVIVAGKTIGRYAMVGAGAVVTKNVRDFELVYGNPACMHGYVCICGKRVDLREDFYRCSCGRCYDLNGTDARLVEEA